MAMVPTAWLSVCKKKLVSKDIKFRLSNVVFASIRSPVNSELITLSPLFRLVVLCEFSLLLQDMTSTHKITCMNIVRETLHMLQSLHASVARWRVM